MENKWSPAGGLYTLMQSSEDCLKNVIQYRLLIAFHIITDCSRLTLGLSLEVCCTGWAVVLIHWNKNTPLNISSSGYKALLTHIRINHFRNNCANLHLNDFRLPRSSSSSSITCGWCDMQPHSWPPFFLSLYYNWWWPHTSLVGIQGKHLTS